MKIINKIYGILRKHYWWTNTIFGFIFIITIIYLTSKNMNSAWTIAILLPFFSFNIINLQMLVGKKELLFVLFFLLAIFYALSAWIEYKQSGNIYSIFTLETIKTFFMIILFISIPAFIFGYIPIVLLTMQDKMYPRKWRPEDTPNATFYIYRKLPDQIASKTSIEELWSTITSGLPINTKLIKSDLKIITKLKNDWMKKMGIKDAIH